MKLIKNTKRIISIILSLAAVMPLSSCARKDPYKWEGHSREEVRRLYHERFDEFQNVADIIAGNQDFWEKGRRYPEAEGSAWIMSPNDEKKMAFFSDKDQAAITDFFNATKPYMIELKNNKYVEFDFINEDKTAGYSFVYYSSVDGGDGLEEWKEETKSHFGTWVELSDKWLFLDWSTYSH